MKPVFSTDNLEAFEVVVESSKETARMKIFMAMMTINDNSSLRLVCACKICRPKYGYLDRADILCYPDTAYYRDDDDVEGCKKHRDEDIALVHEFLLGLRDHIGPLDVSENPFLPDDVLSSELLDRLMLSVIDDHKTQLLGNKPAALQPKDD